MDEDFSGDKGCAVADIMKSSMPFHQIVQAACINYIEKVFVSPVTFSKSAYYKGEQIKCTKL